MTILVVSPSALLRSTLKELLIQVAGVDTVRELGSELQLEATLSQFNPALVLVDEVLSVDLTKVGKVSGTSPSVFLLQSPSSPARTKAVSKPDFANASQGDLKKTFLPLLGELVAEASLKLQRGTEQRGRSSGSFSMVVIGASTGGPAAVRTVLSHFGPEFPYPIALVQHIDTGYDEGYASWLAQNSKLKVRLACENDRPKPGEVIVAPNDKHLVCQGETFGLDDGPKVLSQKPAVDRLFSSVARYHGAGVLAVLLTGIGSDGANGCLDIVKGGGITIAQDEASSTVYGMPRAAAELGAATHVLGLNDIGPAVLELITARQAK
jgi:hypothetical protein